MTVIELTAPVLEELIAHAGGGSLRIMVEVEPDERPDYEGGYTGALKLSAERQTWTPPVGAVTIRTERLYS